MSRPLRILYSGAVYHITCRGNERKDIFADDADRLRFLELLRQSGEIYSVRLYCYVLMSNHFHLLIETPLGNLSEFMRRFNISYTGYYNRRYKRVGHLYQGRYKSILVDKDAYLSKVSRYIHLNPVTTAEWEGRTREDKGSYLKTYRWSSLPGYLDSRHRELFVDHAAILSLYGGNVKQYWKEILSDMLSTLGIKDEIIGQSILGGEEFVRKLKRRLPDRDRECPSLKALMSYKAEEEILSAIEEVTGKGIKEIKSDKGYLRYVTMEMLYRLGGMKGKEIGNLFGVDYSTVSVGRKRLRERLSKDKGLRQIVEGVEEKLSLIKN